MIIAAYMSGQWCSENFIQARSLRRASDVRKQLLGIMERYKHEIVSCGKNYSMSTSHFAISGYTKIDDLL